MEVKPHAWLEIDENVFGVPVYRGVVHWTPDEIAGEHRRVPIFTAEQLRAYAESCARMAREEERERIESSEVVQFLYGADALDGVVFSEVPPGKPRYWWRSILRATIKGLVTSP